MKRLSKRIIAVLIVLSLLPSCQTSGDGKTGELNEYFTGEMLKLTAHVTSDMGNADKAENMVNSVGMSGMYASNHMHDSSSDGMYITKESPAEVFFTFETEVTEAIGRVFIWNYSEKGNTSAGLKLVTAEYSRDGKEYIKLGDFEIKQAEGNGEDAYSAVIDFEGVAARFIRLTPAANYGDKNNRYGLSEVRCYRFKTHPDRQGSIITASYKATENSAVTNGENAVNNSGMSGTLSVKDTHGNDPKDMTCIDISGTKNEMVFDLDGTYPIESISIWNYNDPENLDMGMKNITLYYSPDGSTFIPVRDENKNSVITLNRANGSESLAPTDTVNMGGVNTGFIKIEVQKNDGTYGNTQTAGISEIRFTVAEGWAVEPARDWTGLFSRQNGWLAADGIYTANLNGYDVQGSSDENTKTLFIFSDTAVGSIDYRNMSVHQTGFYNHTFAYLTGNEPDPKKLKFVLSHSSGGNVFQDAIWLTDLVRLDSSSLRIGGFKFNSSWGADRMDMITVPISKTSELPIFMRYSTKKDVLMKYVEKNADVMMYSGILNESRETGNPKGDGYIYMYGFRNSGNGKKNLIVARTLPENFDKIDAWEYFTGEEWEKGIAKANTKDAYISKEDISSELSVTKINSGMFKNKYMLVYTASTMSSHIKFALSDSPEGPFENAQFLYYCPEVEEYKAQGDEGIYTYNCKAHPSLSNKGELLISYNVNSTTNYGSNTYRYYPQFVKMYEIK